MHSLHALLNSRGFDASKGAVNKMRFYTVRHQVSYKVLFKDFMTVLEASGADNTVAVQPTSTGTSMKT